MSVITDRKRGAGVSAGAYTYYLPAVVSASDYYAFGLEMQSYTAPLGVGGAGSYRYGFNGKENDRGNFGLQLVQDYGMRLYNPSIGKFLSIDPLSKQYPWYTPYQFAGNKPIWAIDLDGLEEAYANGVVAYPNKEKAIRYDYTYPSGAMASTVPGSDTWHLSERDKDGFTTTYSWNPGEKNWSLINSERADYDDRNQSVAKLNNALTLITFGVPAVIMGGGAIGVGEQSFKQYAISSVSGAVGDAGTSYIASGEKPTAGGVNKWLYQVDKADILSNFLPGKGMGREILKNVLDAAIDVSEKDGRQSLFNGGKSVSKGAYDFGTGMVKSIIKNKVTNLYDGSREMKAAGTGLNRAFDTAWEVAKEAGKKAAEKKSKE